MSALARTALERGKFTRTRLVDPWRISLWLVQLVLATVFGYDGLARATQPIGAVAEAFLGSGQVADGLVRAIGAGELITALGLVLPTATRILPFLTPLAALWLALLMGTAFVFHAMCGEWHLLSVNVALGLLAAFVAWGRLAKAPVHSQFGD
jgi:putative oxidoreductase